MKTCCKCSESKDEECFHKDATTKDGLYPFCKMCRKEVKRRSYLKNKDKILEKQREKRWEGQLWLSQFKQKCELCGESHPACLDFHHEGDKEIGIANLMNRNNINDKLKQRVLKEIKKCTVLCANCHRKKHWRQ